MSYEAASREVVAEAMADILPDSHFAEELARQHQNIFEKLLEKLKDFLEDIRTYFAGIYENRDLGANALKEELDGTVRYLEEIVKAYDKMAVGAVEHYQAAEAKENTADEGGVVQKDFDNRISKQQRRSAAGSIQVGMTETQRYEVLREKEILVVGEDRSADYAEEIAQIESLPAKAKSKAEKIIKPLAIELGILGKKMKTPEVEIDFKFTVSSGLSESLHKQLRYGGSYTDFAKALIHLDRVLETAVLIEKHTDKYEGTSRANRNLEMVYVLFGAFQDQNGIVPIQMEIKKTSNDGGRLYLTVAMTKVEVGVTGNAGSLDNSAPSLIPTSKHSISDIFEKINPKDKHFLKYLPDGFLSQDQMKAKEEAIREDEERIARYAEMENNSSNKNTISYQKRTNTLSDREVLEIAAIRMDTETLNAGEKAALDIFQKRLNKLKKLQIERERQGHLWYEQQFVRKIDLTAFSKAIF